MLLVFLFLNSKCSWYSLIILKWICVLQIYVQFMAYLLIFLIVSLEEHKFRIIMLTLSIFFFYVSCFSVFNLNIDLCLTLGCKNFLLFSSTCFIVLDLISKSIIHMKLIFHIVRGVDWCSVLLYMDIQLFENYCCQFLSLFRDLQCKSSCFSAFFITCLRFSFFSFLILRTIISSTFFPSVLMGLF